MGEATIDKNTISFTNGFRVAVSIFSLLWIVVGGVTAHAYFVVLPQIAETVKDNDNKYIRQITENKVSAKENQAYLISMKEDLREIKTLLRRTAPYERK